MNCDATCTLQWDAITKKHFSALKCFSWLLWYHIGECILHHNSLQYVESLRCHSWFEPISACPGAPALGWGSQLHTWLASVNLIDCACCPNRRYRHGARGMHYHILLRQYSQTYYIYNSVAKNTFSPCHKDASVQISIGYTKGLLR